MQKVGRYLYKYKFNILVKGLAGYMVYSDVMHLKHMRTQVILTYNQEAALYQNIFLHSGIFVGICLIL